MLLRYLHGSEGRYHLSVIAGMLSEREPFHKQPLKFFQGVAKKLAKEGKIFLDGDLVLIPVDKLSRNLQARLVANWRHNHA